MARRIEWTDAAWNDLAEIADYITVDSPHYAATFVAQIRDASRSLEELAERGRIVPEFNDRELRELFIKSYRLVYKITPSVVYILGLIHGARLMPNLTTE